MDAHTPHDATLSDGCWSLPVPWKEADAIRAALDRRGQPLVLSLDPAAHEARLVLPRGADPGPVAAAVAEVRTERGAAEHG